MFFFFYVKMGLVNFVYRQMTPRGRAGLGRQRRRPLELGSTTLITTSGDNFTLDISILGTFTVCSVGHHDVTMLSE